MIALLAKHQQDIAKLCQRYFVKRLDVFGSAARASDFTEASDLDFIVEFELLEPVAHTDAYFGLLFALEDLFNRPVDLVVDGVVTNPYVLETMQQHRERVYVVS